MIKNYHKVFETMNTINKDALKIIFFKDLKTIIQIESTKT